MKEMVQMELNYTEQVRKLKALADETRLQIVGMLTDGELCACKIQEKFDFTQPTLSYHMKILTDSGLVSGRRDGAWMRYTLNKSDFESLYRHMGSIVESMRQEDET